MIDQKARLKEKGKDFTPKLSTEILKSLKRAHTVFTIMSSENNHNTFFLKGFEKEVAASLKRQSGKNSVLSINIQVNEKDVLDDQHYQEANYHVLLSSLWKDHATTWNQSKRLKKSDRLKYMLFGLGILILPFLLFFIYYFLGDESTKGSDYLAFIVSLLALGGLFRFFKKQLNEKIEHTKKADRGFSFEKAQIKKRLKILGYRREPTLILIDNAESLDKDPFKILLDLMDEDTGSYDYGVLWVFLFTNKSDRSDELARKVQEKKHPNQQLDLNSYSEKDLQRILLSDPSLRRRGSYLISDREEAYIDQLQDRWVDISEKIDNKEAFTEYDILKIITFGGNRHHIDQWNPTLIKKLFNDAPQNVLNSLQNHLGHTEPMPPNYFQIGGKLSEEVNADFFQSRRFARGKFVIPFQLRVVFEDLLGEEELALIHLFWIKKYLMDYRISEEDLLAKRILFRINRVEKMYRSDNKLCELHGHLIKDIQVHIIKLLDELFANLSYRTFGQFYKALQALGSLLGSDTLSTVEKEKLIYYSAYLFELSGDPQFQNQDPKDFKDDNLPLNNVFNLYQRLLHKESPAILLADLESMQGIDNFKEKPWLSNLYGLLLLFLRVREADGFVFMLREDVSVAANLNPPMESDFPVFEIRYRFLLLDVHLEQNSDEFLPVHNQLVERIQKIPDDQLALRALKIYWSGLAAHYWMALKKKRSDDPAIQGMDIHPLLQDELGDRDPIQWVKDQYVDAEFLFELLSLDLPLIDLYYSRARLVQEFTTPEDENVSAWYATWHTMFKASMAIQHDLGLSLNVPEIHARVFMEKAKVLGRAKCEQEIDLLLEVLAAHGFNDRLMLYWEHHRLTVHEQISSAKALETTNRILSLAKDKNGYLSYVYNRWITTKNDKIVEFSFRTFMVYYIEDVNSKEEAYRTLELLEQEFLLFKRTYQSKGQKEEELVDEIETSIFSLKLIYLPEKAIELFFDLRNHENIIRSDRFPFLLGQLFRLVPVAKMDHDLLLFFLQTINKNVSRHLKSEIISGFLKIGEYFNPTTFSSFSQELKDNILRLVKAVGSSEYILYTTTYDELEEQFGNLMACDSSEPYYQQQWHKWYRLKLSSFIVEKLEKLYDEQSSYEIFQIYLNFFEKYEENLPFQDDVPIEVKQKHSKIIFTYNSKKEPENFAEAILQLLQKNRLPLVANYKINRITWLWAKWLRQYMHHLNQPERPEAKELLENLFNPATITDYLIVVRNIKTIPAPIKTTIDELIGKHKQHEYKLKRH